MQAFFLPLNGDEIFTVYYPADKGNKQFILHIPAFAEEMNCARHIVSQQCRAFAELGYSVLQIDLFATGDSSGDFSEATWLNWKQSVGAACLWLAEQGAESVIFWGLRVGALLAMDCISTVNLKVDKLILWQPVLSGEQFVQQFLRLKTAGAMLDVNALPVKVTELKQQLLSGQFVEVSGYLLNPALMMPIIKLDAFEIEFPSEIELVLFDISNNKSQISAKTISFVEHLKLKQRLVEINSISGPLFWSTHGCDRVPELILSTLQCCR